MAKNPAGKATANTARSSRPQRRITSTATAPAPAAPPSDQVTMSRADLETLINVAVDRAMAQRPVQEFSGRPRNTRLQPIIRREGIPSAPRRNPRTNRPEVPGQPHLKSTNQTQEGPLMVRATGKCFYQLLKRREGSQFPLEKREDFNPDCMVWLKPDADELHVSVRNQLDADHQAQLVKHQQRARAGQAAPSSVNREVEDEVL